MDLTPIEDRISHLTRAMDDLSDVVAAQSREIAALTRRVALLMEREAEREAAGPGAPPIDRPPHY